MDTSYRSYRTYPSPDQGIAKEAVKAMTSFFTRLEIDSSSGFLRISEIQLAICTISGSFIPREVTAGVPRRMPLVTKGLRLSKGMPFLLTVIVGVVAVGRTYLCVYIRELCFFVLYFLKKPLHIC